MTTLRGFLRVRGAYSGLIFLVTICVIVMLFPNITFVVAVNPELPARAVGAPESFSLMVASFLPWITQPHFNDTEGAASRSRRAAHAAYTTIVILGSCLPYLAWYARLRPTSVGYQLGPVIGLLGLPIILGALGMLALLLVGTTLSLITPPIVFGAVVLTQHLYPSGITAHVVNTDARWHTCGPWLP